MKVLPTLRVLCISEWHTFLLGDRQSPEVWLRAQYEGLWGQVSGDISLKSQFRVSVRALGHGRLDLPALRQDPQSAELRMGFGWCIRLWILWLGARWTRGWPQGSM